MAAKAEPVFVEKDGVISNTFPIDCNTFVAANLDLHRGKKQRIAFILKMKANDKEPVPKFFDVKERKTFHEAESREWQAWEDLGSHSWH